MGARTLLVAAAALPVAASPFLLSSAATPPPQYSATALDAAVPSVDPLLLEMREDRASRSSSRTLRAVTLTPKAVDHDWATADLNVWTEPREQGRRTGLVDSGDKVAVTGQRTGRWAEALVGGKARWVNADYLAEEKPKPKPAASGGGAVVSGVSAAPCPDGSATESGITSNAVIMFRGVCNAFPALAVYGGYDNHGEHADGRAVDFMTSSSLGNAVAEWARANAGALRIRSIIWAQRIWTPEQASAGWRPMEDRGSATANHYDHVHISVF